MEVEVAGNIAQAFQHGFSAGVAIGLVIAALWSMLRNWRRDP